ncbi:MAG: hypothetical protein ACK5WP_01130 [Neisseriaceae bacterium]|jgi:hypothetical protein
MKLLKRLFKQKKIISEKTPSLVLSEYMVLVDDITKKPYFLVSPNGSHSSIKLYVDEFIAKKQEYQILFSISDYGHIMFCIGGLHCIELNNVFQIVNFEFNSKNIEVQNKSTGVREIWNISEIIATQKYLLLDKSSILKIGILFEKENKQNSYQILNDESNAEQVSKLRLIK